MANDKKRQSHYRDRTICGLACFAAAYVVAGALMASLGIRVVLEYPLFKTGSVIWGGLLVFATGVYILALCRCMQYLNKLKVAVILIMQILVCAVCIANVPILKCVEWKYFNGALQNNGEVIEDDDDVIYFAYLLTLVGTVIGLVSSIFGIIYTVIITHRIRSRLKHYLADIERIRQSSERKKSPNYDDVTGEVIPRNVAGRSVNVSPCSWVFHDGCNEQPLRTEIASEVSGLQLDSSTSCCEETMLMSQSMQNRFMDKRLARQQPVVKHQTHEPLINHSQIAIQDHLTHEQRTMIPPNPMLRYDQVLMHPSSTLPSLISIVSSPLTRIDSLTTETIVDETGLNSTDWAIADQSASLTWPSPPSCIKPVLITSPIISNDDVIPAPPNFQDEPIDAKNDDSLLPICFVPEIVISRPQKPSSYKPTILVPTVVDENDNAIVPACRHRANLKLPPRNYKHMITFMEPKADVEEVNPQSQVADFDSPAPPQLSRQGSMCNLMGDPSPLFDMTCTRL